MISILLLSFELTYPRGAGNCDVTENHRADPYETIVPKNWGWDPNDPDKTMGLIIPYDNPKPTTLSASSGGWNGGEP